MDSRRLILFFVFSFSVFLLLDAWQREHHAPVAPAPAARQQAQQPSSAAPPVPSEKLADRSAPPPQAGGAATLAQGELVTVDTDVYRAQISTAGGDLRRLELKQQAARDDQSKPFVLFQASSDHVYIAQSGLIGGDLPNHRTTYTVTARQYNLAPGVQTIEVRLAAPEKNGVKVTKIYRFHRGSYVIDVGYELTNDGGQPISPFAYFQLVRDSKPAAGDSKMVPTFNGVAAYTEQDKFQKAKYEDVEKGKVPFPKTSHDGWIAVLQHYFFSAWLPQGNVEREFYARHLQDDLYAAGVIVPVGTIAPGQSAKIDVPLYAGPQEQEKLSKLAPGLELTVDYGWLTIIAVPLFWLLSQLQHVVRNWGLAIILLTVIIKVLFYPLSAAGYRSMARMRVVAPKLQRLKEQYGNDRQKMQQAMMELYRTEKINPLGGCLPIVIQIPVFIALYWVLLASVELRHAPFYGWIHDLSAPDPWYVLPILMGATMIIQTRLNPEPPDPVQAKVMKIMPVAFSVFFFFFPAGLVLYWLVNNILSIAQQWRINRVLERANLAPKRS